MIINDKKPLALASIAHKAKIEPYRLSRWFYGMTKLQKAELARLKEALNTAGARISDLSERVDNELKH